MGKPISNITIVGGGTTGWIVAGYLIRSIANHRRLIDHVRSQAVPGESASALTKRMSAAISTGRELVATAQPVMALHG